MSSVMLSIGFQYRRREQRACQSALPALSMLKADAGRETRILLCLVADSARKDFVQALDDLKV